MKFKIEDVQRGEVQCYQWKGHDIWESEPIRVLLEELVFNYFCYSLYLYFGHCFYLIALFNTFEMLIIYSSIISQE